MSAAGMVGEASKAVVGVDHLIGVDTKAIINRAFGLADGVHIGPHHRPEDIAFAQPAGLAGLAQRFPPPFAQPQQASAAGQGRRAYQAVALGSRAAS